MKSTCVTRVLTILLFSFISIVSFSQTYYSTWISRWRSEFPKQEFVAANYNTITGLILNADPPPGFAKASVLAKYEIAIVPPIVLRKK